MFCARSPNGVQHTFEHVVFEAVMLLGFFSSVLTRPGGLLCGHLAEYTPHTVAEGAVRRVKEGTSAVFVQSGFQESWWAEAMGSCCYLRNVQDPAADGQTPYERHFNSPFDGPTIPFGAEVNFYSKYAKQRPRSSASVRHTRLSWENHKQVTTRPGNIWPQESSKMSQGLQRKAIS